MDGLKKDRLEEFFKRNTRNPEIPFNEADWEKLNAQLDKEMPVASPLHSFAKKIWPLPIIGILLFMGWKLWFSPDQSSGEIVTGQSSGTYQDEQIVNDQIIHEHDNSIIFEESVPTLSPVTELKEEKNDAINIQNSESSRPSMAIHHQMQADNQQNQKSGYVVSGNGADFSWLYENSELHFLFPISPSFSLESGETEVKGLPSPEKNKPRKSSGFIVGLGYSPDFSTVGLDNFTSPGTRWKVYMEYNYKNTIALSTGIEYVDNKYKASGDEYHPPYQYWYGGIKPTETYGECIMIDIPLNIRFQVYTRDRHQLFISGGVSSYFILSEDYFFDYDQSDPNLPTQWSTDKMSVYPFSIINASIGYEFRLRGRGSIQIEPYIKIPTAGVGWGNVDLYTTGAYFSYRFRLGRH
jgi:hypothetical protein